MLFGAIIVGLVSGLIYQLGESGIIPHWGNENKNPLIKALLVLTLMLIASSEAETWKGAVLVSLCTVGAAKISAIIVELGLLFKD